MTINPYQYDLSIKCHLNAQKVLMFINLLWFLKVHKVSNTLKNEDRMNAIC